MTLAASAHQTHGGGSDVWGTAKGRLEVGSEIAEYRALQCPNVFRL